MDRLERFLLEHAEQLAGFESSLRTLTYILPGRFEDAEFVSEALYACLNLIGLYHDSLLEKKRKSQEAAELDSQNAGTSLMASAMATMTPFNRYTRSIMQSSPTYRRLAYTLTLLQFTEVFVEMAVRKRCGQRAKWKCVFALEAVKAACRLGMLHLSDGRMQLASAVPERDHDSLRPSDSSPGTTWHSTRTGRPHQSEWELSTESDITQYLTAKALTSAKRNSIDLLSRLRGEQLIGEILFILRPLVYVYLLKQRSFRVDKHSWSPWMVSLIIDLASRAASKGLLTPWLQRRFPGIFSPSTTAANGVTGVLAHEEMRRRLWLLLFYLLRPPFFSRFTKDRFVAICKSIDRMPILSIFSNILREYIPLWDQVYFYTSAS